ncbi:MAG TPA: hypothetical protein VLK23_00610 [Thermodesulfobacteriota bacterium]|nr:hypothetical protein [Thermodesulfobacteriota bacterium]
MVRHSPRKAVDSLRDQIFALLNKKKASFEDALRALSQCEAHIQNRVIVEKIAKECGLKLAGSLVNDELELYYDLRRGRHDMGYISKGWEDPGFRIGDLIEIEKWKEESFKVNAYEILRFCATNGIVLTVQETKDTIALQMEGVIYNQGFNKDTFSKTLETLNECIEKTQELLAR